MSLGEYADTYRPQYRAASAVVPMASDLGDTVKLKCIPTRLLAPTG